MSQQETFIILNELGGRATSKVLRERAKEKFPNYSLWQYITERLNRLIYYGDVGFDRETKEYFITEQGKKNKDDWIRVPLPLVQSSLLLEQ